MSTDSTFDKLREPALLALAFAAGLLTGLGLSRRRANRMPSKGKFDDGIGDSNVDDKPKPAGGIFRPRPHGQHGQTAKAQG